jgi:hypothetical protein
MASKTTASNLGEKMFSAAKAALGSKAKDVKQYLKAESEKLAVTLRMIIEGRASGEISKDDATILLNQQKHAASAVLTASEGMTAVAAQAAINAALGVARDFVNGKVGFPLL